MTGDAHVAKPPVSWGGGHKHKSYITLKLVGINKLNLRLSE